MARTVVYAVLALVLFVFLMFSPSPTNTHIRHGQRRLLRFNKLRRSNLHEPCIDPIIFTHRINHDNVNHSTNSDPMSSSSHDVHIETGHAIDDDGILNITSRLHVLFPLLDKSPNDGLISFDELEAWNKEQAIDLLIFRTQKEMESRDKNKDGMISFEEYLPQFSKEDIDKNGMGHGEAGWWMEQFRNADADRNGTLNFDEFNNFLHPEDSSNEAIHKWLLREKIKRMDDDHDQRINFYEFTKYAYDSYKSYAKFEHSKPSLISTPKDKFDELDVNKDKFLTVEELVPMLHYLKPGELSYAKYYTIYLIREADDNGDGLLSLDEMLNHEHTFYSTVYDDYDDYDDDDHDEL